jgi:hypothetical protein
MPDLGIGSAMLSSSQRRERAPTGVLDMLTRYRLKACHPSPLSEVL